MSMIALARWVAENNADPKKYFGGTQYYYGDPASLQAQQFR